MKGNQRLAAVARSTAPMAGALPDLPMPETEMVRLIRICVNGLGDFFDPVFRKLELTENSFHVLCLLMASEGGRASPSELSELVGTSRANMTRILDMLVSDGLASRVLETRDARRHAIHITRAGRKVATEAVPRLIEPLKRAFSDLSPEEFATLEKLLRKSILSFDKGAQPLRNVG
ncbi:MarR family transcriptional regulator [Paraburkholderia sp. USG1]|uniref:MarR family winged helix-turn-helix transcriptional regulator n=1 Tax=Paraburkholderia sp. USG1 TaxID=2952268 RepID=UPI002857AA02|nr:MarR family transcriptional regulator [Paraburkholderia sp. USG1]MDR8398381.1 MarR family transcriptional regulator [Paraburkholderia sp. USG1]